MESIRDLIRREINPFDRTPVKVYSFWDEKQNSSLTVESIHKEAIDQVKEVLDVVAGDRRTRSLAIYGDSGSGKSYLLGRIKKQLNSQAFFAYIRHWIDNHYIWRHILSETVDSLMQKPEGQQESQLLLWIKNLSAFRDSGVKKWVMGERKLFIHNLRGTYPSGIARPKEFFGVLYDLTNPQLYPIACDWLRGEDLDDEDLKALNVKSSIDSEEEAKNILANFGKICAETHPVVLCFDNLDNLPTLSKGSPDLQPWFNVNTTIHSQNFKNFLVILSVVTDNLKKSLDRIQQADKAGMYRWIRLKPIDLKEAEALWATRLVPLHQQADEQPESPIYPLTRKQLEKTFQSGKTNPRNVLILGRRLIEEYKLGQPTLEIDYVAAFKLLWIEEFKKNQGKIYKLSQLSSPERIQMLQEVLKALKVEVYSQFLPSDKFANYSLSYKGSSQSERIGVVWSEDRNMRTFFAVMDACRKALQQNLCQTLYLIRAEKLPESNLKGYKLFQQIFTGSLHRHIIPYLDSIHYLATYYSFVKDARAGELVVVDKIFSLTELEDLIRQTKILNECTLLQNLETVNIQAKFRDKSTEKIKINNQIEEAKEFILNLIKTQQMLGRNTVIENARNQFDRLDLSELNQIIQELVRENKISLLGSDDNPEKQFVCLVPGG